MSREDYVAIASRLFSIYLAYIIVRTVPGALQLARQEQGLSLLIVYFAVLGGGLLVCALLWFFPLTVARKLLPVMREPRSEDAVGPATALSMGLTLIGVWFLAGALVDASYWLVLVMRIKQVDDMQLTWDHEQIANMAATAVQLVAGLWLILGSRGIRRLIYRFRYGDALDAQ